MTRWFPVVGGVLLNLALGSLYAWSVFVLPLEREFGWNREQTSWVFTVAIVAFAAAFVAAGRLQDARGPRLCAVMGATLLSAGFVFASFTTSLLFLYITFGLLVGIGGAFGYAAPTPVASKWFPDKRGLVIGLMVAGFGAGSAIFGPVASALVGAYGWRLAFRILGLLFFVMGLVGASFLKNPPDGYRPHGWSPVPTPGGPPGGRDVPSSAMLRTRTFYALWVAYCLGTTAGLMTISQLVPFARTAGLGASAATFAITVGAVGNAAGRILAGWLSDTVGRLTTVRVMIVGSAIATPALFVWRSDVSLFYILVAAVYWCYGAQLSLFPSITADLYGSRYLGMNYGLLFTAWGVAGILGPFIAARVFNVFHDYGYAFYAAAALALVAFASLGLATTQAARPALAGTANG
ncbi:MAG: OFA family MFS transporter [Acidobacteria bacterium]|nr:OFA family MFS transporter [Acidobacteriota bacterium]